MLSIYKEAGVPVPNGTLGRGHSIYMEYHQKKKRIKSAKLSLLASQYLVTGRKFCEQNGN